MHSTSQESQLVKCRTLKSPHKPLSAFIKHKTRSPYIHIYIYILFFIFIQKLLFSSGFFCSSPPPSFFLSPASAHHVSSCTKAQTCLNCCAIFLSVCPILIPCCTLLLFFFFMPIFPTGTLFSFLSFFFHFFQPNIILTMSLAAQLAAGVTLYYSIVEDN